MAIDTGYIPNEHLSLVIDTGPCITSPSHSTVTLLTVIDPLPLNWLLAVDTVTISFMTLVINEEPSRF